MNLGVIGNSRYPGLSQVLSELAQVAERHSLTTRVEADLAPSWPGPPNTLGTSDELDLLLTFGGDGTLLRGARFLGTRQVPIMGVNLGRVGFLTTASPPILAQAIGEFARGEYELEPRGVLGTRIIAPDGRQQTGELALNDVVVHKAGVARVIHVRVSVDDDEVGQYSADGIIVATPTGSTAYSMSAGGPIVLPAVNALVLTAICPHTLAVRPIVIPGTSEIRIEPTPPHVDEVIVSYDGQVGTTLNPGGHVCITLEPWTLKLVRLRHEGFFMRVREKLQWGDLSDREAGPQ